MIHTGRQWRGCGSQSRQNSLPSGSAIAIEASAHRSRSVRNANPAAQAGLARYRQLGLLKSGRIVDHASLGATVTTDPDGRVVVDDILDDSDAYRRGLRYDDEVIRFGGREISSVNTLKNVLGTYPGGWRVPITFRRDGETFERSVRMATLHRSGELEALLGGGDEQRPPPHQPKPAEEPQPGEEKPPKPADRTRGKQDEPRLPEAVRSFYEEAPGYANYWFNRYHQQRVWNALLTRGDFNDTGWNWTIAAKDALGNDVKIDLNEKNGSIVMPDGQSGAEFALSLSQATSPPRSGGLLAALHLWQRLLLVGPRRFGEIYYLGALAVGKRWRAGRLSGRNLRRRGSPFLLRSRKRRPHRP